MKKNIEYKTVEVNKAWIKKNIIKPGWQRNIYPARVNFFINNIKNNTFDRSSFEVAEDDTNGKLILLDGQHRMEAITKTETSFQSGLTIRYGLSEEEMMKVYEIAQDVKQHRIIDDIKLYVGRNEVLDSFLDEKIFPINVSLGGGINSVRIDRFLNIYKNGISLSMTRRNLSRKNLKGFLENLTDEDFLVMKHFCSFYKACFNDPFKENWLYNNMVMFTIMRFWIKNKRAFSQKEKEMVKAFKPIMDSGAIRMESRGVDLVTQDKLSRSIYKLLNKHRSKNKFEKYWKEE